ncbi:1739_t:CDS:1, partial [Acaulospora colombiana]
IRTIAILGLDHRRIMTVNETQHTDTASYADKNDALTFMLESLFGKSGPSQTKHDKWANYPVEYEGKKNVQP